jgi:DNA-binding transcriptional LysR family regulator
MPLRFTLRQLEYLVAVGESGSIALASEKVNVSSPSISAAISQLEAEFGLSLFVRKHAHGLSLTQGGKQFVSQARQVLAEAGKLNELANQITGHICADGFAAVAARVYGPVSRSRFHPKRTEPS